MGPREILDRVLEAGGAIVNDVPGGPQLLVPENLRSLVEAHRDDLRRLLDAPASGAEPAPAVEPPAMRSLTREVLATFAHEGDAVGIRVPWCPTVLWWAPNATEAAKLVAWGIATPGAVWTATELESLIGLAGPHARAVVLAKLAVDGTIEETRPR